MKTPSFLRTLCGALLLGTAFCSPAAFATPVTYSFTSGSSAFGNVTDPVVAAALAALGSGAVASGTFTYDAAAPFNSNNSDGSSVFGTPAALSFFGLSGTLGSNSFSDPRGGVTVANNLTIGGRPNADEVLLFADPTSAGGPFHNFVGFDLGGTQVVDVRLFWITGNPGVPTDFLSSQTPPGTLPSFSATIAFDLASTTNPSLISTSSVFFNGVTVTPVPEPQTWTLMVAGLVLVGAIARRRRS